MLYKPETDIWKEPIIWRLVLGDGSYIQISEESKDMVCKSCEYFYVSVHVKQNEYV